MLRFKSARSRALLAGAVLLVLLASIGVLATWSTHRVQETNRSLEERATAVASLNDVRAHFFLGATQLLIASFSDVPGPSIDSYRSTVPLVNDDLRQAREELVALNESDNVALLDKTATDMGQLQQAIEGFLPVNLTNDRTTRLGLVIQYIPQMWPTVEALTGDLQRLAEEEQTTLASERSSATHTADLVLATLIVFSTSAFLVGAGMLAFLVVCVVRPLTALQESAKAIAAGNWAARAKVSGPQEIASLAHDFNAMTQTLLDQTAQLRESEQRFRDVLDVSRDFIYKINLQTGEYEYASPAIQVSGFAPEEFVAMGLNRVYERFHPEDRERLIDLTENTLPLVEQDNTAATIEYRWKHKDGQYRWLSDNIVVLLDSDGKPAAIVGAARDVTDRKEAEEALRDLGRQRDMRNSIAEAFLTASDEDVYADVLQVILEATESRYGFFGYINEDGDLVCPSMTRHVSEQCRMVDKNFVFARKSWAGRWGRALTEKKTFLSNQIFHVPEGHIRLERAIAVPIMHQDTVIGELAVASKATDYDEKDRQLVEAAANFIAPILSARLEKDIEQKARKQAEEALQEQARRDPLTGLLNHGAIVSELTQLVNRGSGESPFAVVMTDVNGLKTINDRYGHQTGDAVLVAVARALSRKNALTGRYGGDEFVSLLPGTDRRKAERYRKEVLRAMAKIELTDPETGNKVPVMASVGLALYPEDAYTFADLVKLSDTAMYSEKRRHLDRAA